MFFPGTLQGNPLATTEIIGAAQSAIAIQLSCFRRRSQVILEHVISRINAVRVANNTFVVVIVCENWKSLNGLTRMSRAWMGLAETSPIVPQDWMIL